MRSIIKLSIFVFFSIFAAAFIFLHLFMNIFIQFELISDEMAVYISLIISIILAIVSVIVFLLDIKAEKKTKIGHWMQIYTSKIVLGYIFLILFFTSFESEVFLTKEVARELLSLEWVILGISIAIFLFWNVKVIDYLDKKKPTKPQDCLPTKKMIYIQAKENFYFDCTMLLKNIYLLIANMMIVCASTAAVYLSSKEMNLFTQTILVFGLFLSTNTIIGLIFDILKIFSEKKNEMLKEAKTTISDVELQNAILKDADELLLIAEKIQNSQSIDETQRALLISELIINFKTKYNDESNDKDLIHRNNEN